VEVTHLNRYVSKELSNSGPSIKNDCLNSISLLLQRNPSLPIDIYGFTLNLLDIDVLPQTWCSYYQDSKAPFEESDIGNGDYGLRGMGLLNNICVSNTGPDPILAFLIMHGNLMKRLPLIHVCIPDNCFDPLLIWMILKLSATCYASVANSCVLCAFFLCMI